MSFAFIGAAWDLGGVLSTVILVLGIVGVIKTFLFLRSSFTGWVIEFIESKPLIRFRLGAVFYIVLGIILIVGFGRESEAG